MQHRPGDRGFSSATAARRSRLLAFALAALAFALFAAAAPFALQPLSDLSGARFDIGFYAGSTSRRAQPRIGDLACSCSPSGSA